MGALDLHHCMRARRRVRLADGRTAIIVRIETRFPECASTVEVWASGRGGHRLARVDAAAVVGPALERAG